MPALVKVKLLASGETISMVERNNVKYEVYTNTLQNCETKNESDGFVTYCYINPIYLTKVWR